MNKQQASNPNTPCVQRAWMRETDGCIRPKGEQTGAYQEKTLPHACPCTHALSEKVGPETSPNARAPASPSPVSSLSVSLSLSLPCYSMLDNVEGHSLPIVYV